MLASKFTRRTPLFHRFVLLRRSDLYSTVILLTRMLLYLCDFLINHSLSLSSFLRCTIYSSTRAFLLLVTQDIPYGRPPLSPQTGTASQDIKLLGR